MEPDTLSYLLAFATCVLLGGRRNLGFRGGGPRAHGNRVRSLFRMLVLTALYGGPPGRPGEGEGGPEENRDGPWQTPTDGLYSHMSPQLYREPPTPSTPQVQTPFPPMITVFYRAYSPYPL